MTEETQWSTISKGLLEALHEMPPQQHKVQDLYEKMMQQAERIKKDGEPKIRDNPNKARLAYLYENAHAQIQTGIAMFFERGYTPEEKDLAYCRGKQQLNYIVKAFEHPDQVDMLTL